MCETHLIGIKHYLAGPLLLKAITALGEQFVRAGRRGVNA
jgi:hypothetical protein